MALCGLGTLVPNRPLVDSVALRIAYDVDRNGGMSLLVARLFLFILHVCPVVRLILVRAFHRFVQLTVVYTLAPRRNKMPSGLVIAAFPGVLAHVAAAGLGVWLPPSWQCLPMMGAVVILLGALGTLVGYCWWCTRDLITPIRDE